MHPNAKALRLLVVATALTMYGATASAQFGEPQPASTDAQSPVITEGQEGAAAEPNYALQQPMAAPTYAAAPAPAVRIDGPRFRGGVAFTAGGEFVGAADFKAYMFGVDGRLGVQINDLIGAYVEPHLSCGSAGGATGTTCTFAALAMADVTFVDRFFVGAGFGYGVFNNPSGPALGLRVGAYPVVSRSEMGPRRRGLMVGLDTRFVFLGQGWGTGTQVMFAVGYEAF